MGSVGAVVLRGSDVAVVAEELLPAGLRGEVDVGQALNGELGSVQRRAGRGGVFEAVARVRAVGGVLDQLVDGEGAGPVGVEVDQRRGALLRGGQAEGGGGLRRGERL